MTGKCLPFSSEAGEPLLLKQPQELVRHSKGVGTSVCLPQAVKWSSVRATLSEKPWPDRGPPPRPMTQQLRLGGTGQPG